MFGKPNGEGQSVMVVSVHGMWVLDGFGIFEYFGDGLFEQKVG